MSFETPALAEEPRQVPVSIEPGVRFAFGKNWTRFLDTVNEQRINQAADNLTQMVGVIRNKSFLDAGCGSGIHSLAAVRLGAASVTAFDYDPQSVECASELKRRFGPDAKWTIQQGSVLDGAYLHSLGKFDIVYSWGVLHHSGDMWTALDLVTVPVADTLAIAIYNDNGMSSRIWRRVKRRYSRSGIIGQLVIEAGTFLATWGKHALVNTIRLRPWDTVRNWREYWRSRGMSPWTDVVDWAGGYPFEVAKPCEIFSFYRQRGFILEYMKTDRGHGCNQFTFTCRR